MAKVMLSERNGKLNFYLAKKDLEETIISVEFDSAEKWGGEMVLANGEKWFVEPKAKKLPGEFEAKRLSE